MMCYINLPYMFLCFSRDHRRGGRSPAQVPKYLIPAAAHQQPPAVLPGGAQFGPFSPGAAPPPAHQSPRHMHYTTHPLPAHIHPVIPSTGLHPCTYQGPIHPQIAAPTYVNSPTGGVYTAYPLSPTKTRPYQYLYQTFAGE